MFKAMMLLIIGLVGAPAMAEGLPTQPTLASHPGSSVYPNQMTYQSQKIAGRSVDVFLPQATNNNKVPVIVFGHGQAIDLSGYKLTFEHLAKKGVAIIFPQYDNGFFDQDWRRMADDFNRLTVETLSKYASIIDADKIVYAGHSKGAYIALMAAGAPKRTNKVGSVVLFEPAGHDSEYTRGMDNKIPVTVTWADRDDTTKQDLIRDIYSQLPALQKQFIEVKSYVSTSPQLPADHFFPLSKSFFFGGKDGISAFHFYGTWKWLLGAAWDLQEGDRRNNTYLYGAEAETTGTSSSKHIVTRTW